LWVISAAETPRYEPAVVVCGCTDLPQVGRFAGSRQHDGDEKIIYAPGPVPEEGFISLTEPGRWPRIVAMMLSAAVLGIIGATAGSWIGGLNPGPLPDNTEALRIAQEITPGVTPVGELERRDYVYGSRLGDEDSGPGHVEIPYQLDDGTAVEVDEDDCRLDQLARANAVKRGWEDFDEIAGFSCTSWHAQRGDLVLAWTHDGLGPVVTFYRSTTGASIGALLGAVMGALAGLAGCRVRGRRPWVLIAALTPPALVLVPVTALFLVAGLSGAAEGPAMQFWTLWPILFRLFFFYRL
jgi:hypothetical protein